MASTDAMLFDVLLRQDMPGDAEVLVSSGAVVANKVVNTKGRYNHAFQISAISGSDSYKLQGRIGTGPFVDIVKGDATATLTGNGIYQFTGLWDEIQAVKNSGTGTAALGELRSRF